MPDDKPDMLAALSAFSPGQSSREHYDAWAPDYEADLIGRLGYSAHTIGAAAMGAESPDRSLSLIDIGCGTGFVGMELAALGFSTIDGLDMSDPMMALARAKGVYRRLIAADLMAGAGLPDASHDGAICVGSFAPGHLGPAALAEIIRLVRPGGPIVIVMNARPWEDEDYQSEVDRLSAAGKWLIKSIDSINYMDKIDRPGKRIVASRGV